MAILTIRSTNPDLSFILQKNPMTIDKEKKPFSKAIRRGMAYGWYTASGAFRLWFKDNPHEVSYPMDDANPEFEFLDRTRYAHPFLVNSLISECFSTAMKKQDEKDVDGYVTRLETTIEIRSKSMANHLPRVFTIPEEGREFTLEHLAGDAYIMRIEGNTVYEVLNTAIVASVLVCTSDPTIYVDLRDSGVDKYARSLNASNSPYFARYLFNRNVFSNFATFRKNKPQLDTPTMDFAFGDTHRQRMDYVFPFLKKGNRSSNIHEIGTGEGKYTITLATLYDTVTGWESEEELREKVSGKLNARGLGEGFISREGLTAEYVLENKDEFDGADILITEVFEHIEYEEATNLLKALLQTNFARLIATLPNIEFNVMYKLDQPFRHDDHKWEPTPEHLLEWVTRAAMEVGQATEPVFSMIGDKVTFADGVVQTPSLGFSFDRTQEVA